MWSMPAIAVRQQLQPKQHPNTVLEDSNRRALAALPHATQACRAYARLAGRERVSTSTAGDSCPCPCLTSCCEIQLVTSPVRLELVLTVLSSKHT